MRKKIFQRIKRLLNSPKSLSDARRAAYRELGFDDKELNRISTLPSRRLSTTIFQGKEISFPDAYWFLHSLDEIFVDEVYRFNTHNNRPFIIDCGANIGLSIIYFKRLFPDAKILGFEPDADIFNLMAKNLDTHGLQDCQLVNKGVWKETTTLSFLAEGTLGGKVVEGEPEQPKGSKVVTIETVRLKDYLTQKVDFLKIDIEGAEYDVLADCADALRNVEWLFIEYHSKPAQEQKLGELLEIVKAAGFRYYIKEASESLLHPFVDEKDKWFDLQLNIFCYRN